MEEVRMRRLFMLIVGALLLAAPAHGGYPYVGLFVDSLRTGVALWTDTAPVDFEMWIWWLPDPAKGLSQVEFKIMYKSAAASPGAVTTNPLIVSETGSLATGDVAALAPSDCQYSWFWSHHQNLTALRCASNTIAAIIEAYPGSSPPVYDVVLRSCEPGSPAYACVKVGWGGILYINGEVAVERSTWGAIKSLYQ
jgi:hypothetical protein